MRIVYEDVTSFRDYLCEPLRKLSWSDEERSAELVEAIRAANDAIKKAYNIYYEEVRKPQLEEEKRKEEERSLREDTRFKVSHREADLIDSVLGQMSDGKWENNKAYDKYWQNISVEEDDTVVVKFLSLRYWVSAKELNNYFMTPEGIKKFFAHKAQLVHNDDLRYQFGTTKIKGHENEQAHYLDSFADKTINQTYGEIQETINMLAGK